MTVKITNLEFYPLLMSIATWAILISFTNWVSERDSQAGSLLAVIVSPLAITWLYKNRHNFGRPDARGHFDEIGLLEMPPRTGDVLLWDPPTVVEGTDSEEVETNETLREVFRQGYDVKGQHQGKKVEPFGDRKIALNQSHDGNRSPKTSESGLSLNAAKCEVFFVNSSPEANQQMAADLNHLLPGIKVLDASSFQLLGAPILADGISETLAVGLNTVKTLCKRLPLLDIHPALRILRCSLSSPKFQYLLRTSPTFSHVNKLAEIDDFYRRTLEEITNNKISDTSWTQASLPLAHSGLGIRKMVDLAHPAYFSSVYQSEILSNRMLASFDLSIFTTSFSSMIDDYPADLIPVASSSKLSQKSWDGLRVKSIYDELFSSSGPVERARLLASSTKPSSKWLQAVPSPHLGLLLDNDSARIAIALRLGNKVCEPHPCICGELVNSDGHHGLSCNKTKGKYTRHAELNKIFSMAFSSAGFPNTLEPYGLSRRDGKRPDGLTSYPWSHGKSLIWDVTVVDTVAATYLNLTSTDSGSAADKAERDKHNNYIDLKEQYNFTPLAFETLGAVGPETEVFLKKLGKHMSSNNGEPRSLDFLLQRISIAIQRGNSVCVRGTYCDSNELNVFM